MSVEIYSKGFTKEEVKNAIGGKFKSLVRNFREHKAEAIVGGAVGFGVKALTRIALASSPIGLGTVVGLGMLGGAVIDGAKQVTENYKEVSRVDPYLNKKEKIAESIKAIDPMRMAKAAVIGGVSAAVGFEVGEAFGLVADTGIGQYIGEKASEVEQLVLNNAANALHSITDFIHTPAVAETITPPAGHVFYQFEADRPPLPVGTPETLENTRVLFAPGTEEPSSSLVGKAQWMWFQAAAEVTKAEVGDHVDVLVDGGVQTVDLTDVRLLDPFRAADAAYFNQLSNDPRFDQIFYPESTNIAQDIYQQSFAMSGSEVLHPIGGDVLLQHKIAGQPVQFVIPTLEENVIRIKTALQKVA